MFGMETLAITYGLGCAITWGAGDFSGGFASKKGNTLLVVLFSQLIGALMLIGLVTIFSETMPALQHLLWGGLGGVFGSLGLIALYTALSAGKMSIVAPVSAVITAVVPIIFSFSTEGVPKTTRLIGFLIALVAVWVLSSYQSTDRVKKTDLYLALASGFGFGLFFVCIDRASEGALFWPLVSARGASIILISLLLIISKGSSSPKKLPVMFIALAGILDSLGNVFFALAAQQGRLDLAAILGSLYPVSTVFLAGIFLKERLQRRQWIGVVTAASALILISL